jgi:hypothetical protein
MPREQIVLQALAHYRAVQEWTIGNALTSKRQKASASALITQIDASVNEIKGIQDDEQDCYCCQDPEHCCPRHGTHVMPHRGCILR